MWVWRRPIPCGRGTSAPSARRGPCAGPCPAAPRAPSRGYFARTGRAACDSARESPLRVSTAPVRHRSVYSRRLATQDAPWTVASPAPRDVSTGIIRSGRPLAPSADRTGRSPYVRCADYLKGVRPPTVGHVSQPESLVEFPTLSLAAPTDASQRPLLPIFLPCVPELTADVWKAAMRFRMRPAFFGASDFAKPDPQPA